MAKTRTLKPVQEVEMIQPKVVEPGPVIEEVQLPPAEMVMNHPKPAEIQQQPVIQEMPPINMSDALNTGAAFNIRGDQFKAQQSLGGSLADRIRKSRGGLY